MTETTEPSETPQRGEQTSPAVESTDLPEPSLTEQPTTPENLAQEDEDESSKAKEISSELLPPGNEPLSGETEDETPAVVIVKPPDGGWGWVVVAASFVCNFFVDGMIFSFGVYISEMGKSLNASKPEVALVGSLLSGFYLLAGPFVSALANKFGFRIVTIAGAILAAIGFFSASFANSIFEMFIYYGIVGGLGFGLIYSPSILIVGFYFERWRALATGIAVCGSGIGILVLAPVTANLINLYGWRYTVQIHAGMVLVCVLCGLLFRPLPPLQIELEPETADGTSTGKMKKIKTPTKGYPTAAEVLAITKSTQSLSPSLILTRVAALGGQVNTQSVPMIPVKKRVRTTSENSSIVPQDRSRRGTVTDYIPRSRRGTLTKGDDTVTVNRPLYRDDIFFSGSLHRLPDYQSSQRDFMGYTLSVTRLPTKKDLEEEEQCTLFPQAVKRALGTLFDTSLLKSPSFIMLSLSGFLTLMGIFTPFIYMTDRAVIGGMSDDKAAWLLSAVGVTNTLGRVICGILSSCPGMDALLINNVALTLGGIATMVSSVSLSAEYQFSYCAIFGLTLACFASLRSIIVVDLLGIDKLTNAFGILCLFQGLAAVLGSPLAGYIMEATGSYEWSFIVAGSFILLSGIMCYPLNIINRWESRKRKEEVHDEAFI